MKIGKQKPPIGSLAHRASINDQPARPGKETIMPRKNVFAMTEPYADYPAYVSLNRDEDGKTRLTVRSRGNGGRDVGTIELTPEQLEALVCDISEYLHAGEKP